MSPFTLIGNIVDAANELVLGTKDLCHAVHTTCSLVDKSVTTLSEITDEMLQQQLAEVRASRSAISALA